MSPRPCFLRPCSKRDREETERERDRERDREGDKERDRERDTERERSAETIQRILFHKKQKVKEINQYI